MIDLIKSVYLFARVVSVWNANRIFVASSDHHQLNQMTIYIPHSVGGGIWSDTYNAFVLNAVANTNSWAGPMKTHCVTVP